MSSSSRPLCWSYQHPSTTPHTGWVEVDVAWDSVDCSSVDGIFPRCSSVSDISLAEEDVEDDDVSLAFVPTGAFALYLARPLQAWIERIGARMIEANEFVNTSQGRISWDLPPLDYWIGAWAPARIRDELDRGYVRQFYIGLTADLRQRWEGNSQPTDGREPWSGHSAKWQKMILVGVSKYHGEIAQAEIETISQFRRFDARGYFVNEGDFRCQNKKPGGEGSRGIAAPHILYICYNWNRRGR